VRLTNLAGRECLVWTGKNLADIQHLNSIHSRSTVQRKTSKIIPNSLSHTTPSLGLSREYRGRIFPIALRVRELRPQIDLLKMTKGRFTVRRGGSKILSRRLRDTVGNWGKATGMGRNLVATESYRSISVLAGSATGDQLEANLPQVAR